MVFNNPDRDSHFVLLTQGILYSVELFQDPSFFLWGEKKENNNLKK